MHIEPYRRRLQLGPTLRAYRVTLIVTFYMHTKMISARRNNPFQAVFLCCYPDCPSCSQNTMQMGWSTWSIWAAITRRSTWRAQTSLVEADHYSPYCPWSRSTRFAAEWPYILITWRGCDMQYLFVSVDWYTRRKYGGSLSQSDKSFCSTRYPSLLSRQKQLE